MSYLNESQVEIVTMMNTYDIGNGWSFCIDNSLNSTAFERRNYNVSLGLEVFRSQLRKLILISLRMLKS